MAACRNVLNHHRKELPSVPGAPPVSPQSEGMDTLSYKVTDSSLCLFYTSLKASPTVSMHPSIYHVNTLFIYLFIYLFIDLIFGVFIENLLILLIIMYLFIVYNLKK